MTALEFMRATIMEENYNRWLVKVSRRTARMQGGKGRASGGAAIPRSHAPRGNPSRAHRAAYSDSRAVLAARSRWLVPPPCCVAQGLADVVIGQGGALEATWVHHAGQEVISFAEENPVNPEKSC